MTVERSQAKAALLILAVYNIVQNSVLNEEGYVPGNLAVTGTLLGLGREAGLDWEDMGLSPGEALENLRIGAMALFASTTFLAVVPRIPKMRPYLRDERTPVGPRRETMRRAFVRYPVGTALFEEVAFRGVLPALLASERQSGDLAAAIAFAAWHLIPTHHALRVNDMGDTKPSYCAGTLVGAVAAGIAGFALSKVRRRTGSLFAPWVIHSAINTTSYLAVLQARSQQS